MALFYPMTQERGKRGEGEEGKNSSFKSVWFNRKDAEEDLKLGESVIPV